MLTSEKDGSSFFLVFLLYYNKKESTYNITASQITRN